MFCIVAFVVLAVMGIFSAAYRDLAAEAFACVGKRVTFRPCDTGFKEKMKAQLVGSLVNRSVVAARMVNKHYELIAWIFFLLTVWSIYATADGLYNYYRYGSCEGLNQSSFCVLDPSGSNNAISGVDVPEGVLLPECSGDADASDTVLNSIPLDRTLYPRLPAEVENRVVMIGCFECEYTREAYPRIQRLRTEHEVDYMFVHYPTRPTTAYLTGLTQCAYEADVRRWVDLVDKFFTTEPEVLHNEDAVYDLVETVGYDRDEIRSCATSEVIQETVQTMRQQVVRTGIYGTPLIFINDQPVVGPKPYRVYRFMLE